jgi:hypothetical protein
MDNPDVLGMALGRNGDGTSTAPLKAREGKTA